MRPFLRILAAGVLLTANAFSQTPAPSAFQPAPGERIALVGGSFGDVLGQEGTFEALLHSRFAKSELIVRNFCRPADAVNVRQRPGNYTVIDDPMKVFGWGTLICFFGNDEAFAGAAGVAQFKADYPKTLDEYAKNHPAKNGALKFVLRGAGCRSWMCSRRRVRCLARTRRCNSRRTARGFHPLVRGRSRRCSKWRRHRGGRAAFDLAEGH